MGVWGYKLYQNDLSLDVRDEFQEMYRDGKKAEEITEKLLEEYRGMIGDPTEEPLFWFALADIQWKCGVLMPEVREKAFYWMEHDRSMECCQPLGITENVELQLKHRKKVLEQLKEKLLSPQPPVRKQPKRSVYICPWAIGDVFAYQLESDEAKERGLYGCYLLIRKVGEERWYPHHIIPVVHIKITKDATLPATVEEYDQLEYVQTWFCPYEERFLPIDMKRPKEDIEEKSKRKYEVDEYGIMPIYREALVTTSKRVIPKKLIYINNFKEVVPPKKEFIPDPLNGSPSTEWKNFESKILMRYGAFNLKESAIYRENNSQGSIMGFLQYMMKETQDHD